jgi:hypothetical protein
MKCFSGWTAVQHFYATDFDNAMALLRLKTRRFGVNDNLAHVLRKRLAVSG